MIARGGLLGRLRIALLCAALVAVGGAPSASVLAETPRAATAVHVTSAPSRPAPSRRAHRPLAAPAAPARRSWLALAPPRAPSPAHRPAARPPYLAFHALLR